MQVLADRLYINVRGHADLIAGPLSRQERTPAEAKRLEAASRKQINDTRLLKQQLMEELSVWIAKHHLKQGEAAEILVVSRPRVSDVVNKKTAKFTIDT